MALSRLEQLPQPAFTAVSQHLDASDLCTLAQTSRALHRLSTNDDIWRAKITADFGDRQALLASLQKAGIDLTEHLQTAPLAPWQPGPNQSLECYKQRHAKVHPQDQNTAMESVKTCEATLDLVKEMLRAPSKPIDVFTEAAFKVLTVQECFPTSPECYYLWALMCFMMNAIDVALEIAQIAHQVDPEFAPAQELLGDIEKIHSGVYGTDADAPLLNANASDLSAEFARVLAVLFQRLDRDRDGVLNASEIASLVEITNGIRPQTQVVAQMIGAFGGKFATKTGRGRVAGWDSASLNAFYVAQSLDDPDETRGDIAKFGFDSRSLKPVR